MKHTAEEEQIQVPGYVTYSFNRTANSQGHVVAIKENIKKHHRNKTRQRDRTIFMDIHYKLKEENEKKKKEQYQTQELKMHEPTTYNNRGF